MLSRQQQPHPGGDDRERIARARQAAEALFASKPPVSPPSIPQTATADQSARKPRVLAIIPPPAPASAPSAENQSQIAPASPTAEIPHSLFPRIRTWIKYGMTAAQVAQVYGVSADEIERILRKA